MALQFLKIEASHSPHERFVLTVANLCARLFRLGDYSVSFPEAPIKVIASGDCMKSGALLAGMELRNLLAQTSDGRKALRDLGFEPVLEHVEGE